jgi:hypothetical protein
MRRGAISAVIFLLCALACQGTQLLAQDTAHAWRLPKAAPLLTRWARDVSPANVHPEYPRPQMARPEWLNLNGLWEYAEMKPGDASPFSKSLGGGRILVPFPVESALSGVMRRMDRMWYRRTFTVPPGWAGRRVLLHFGAVDWESTVYINGKLLGRHRGGYDEFSFDITEALAHAGPQELLVGVFDPTDAGDQPRGKQVRSPGGIWYTSTTGIWQTVWMEPVADAHIEGLTMTPDVGGECLHLAVNVSPAGRALDVKATASDSGILIGASTGRAGTDIRIPVPSPKLWSPSAPFLYDLAVVILRDGKPVDEVRGYFGMREIRVARDKRGIDRLMLNGRFELMVGPLDQGFWPDGIYTAPCDEALRTDIEAAKKLGFTMARKHVKVEPERWYYWADKLGLLVWQDMPSGNNGTAQAKTQFETELARLVATHRNHPSIIMWVVFNEGWGQYDTERLTSWVKGADPSRLVDNASGWTDRSVGDVTDIHSYPAPEAPRKNERRAGVLGEFGGLGLAVDGHTWKKEHWGYQGMASAEALTSRYEIFLERAYRMRDTAGLSAAVYTQLTDVEVECNGLLTYDREILKPDAERIAHVNRGDFSLVPPPPVVEVVVPTSEAGGQTWRYTVTRPGGDWQKTGYDVSGWKEGPGGFGTEGTPGARVGTVWNTPDIWLRREVVVPDRHFSSLHFRIHHDEDAEVYVNGVQVGEFSGYVTEYEDVPVGPEAVGALVPGNNIIAVHCRQTGGGQYIDLGIVDVLPRR